MWHVDLRRLGFIAGSVCDGLSLPAPNRATSEEVWPAFAPEGQNRLILFTGASSPESRPAVDSVCPFAVASLSNLGGRNDMADDNENTVHLDGRS